MNAAENRNAWTDSARVDLLKKLWADGLSCSQIARQLNATFIGAGVSRNAVIGKANRLGLAARNTGPASTAPWAVPRGGAGQVRAARERAARPAPTPAPKLKVIADRQTFVEADSPPPRVAMNARAFAPLPGCTPVPFGSRGCKWPVGGEGASMLCCGAEREGEKPYCTPHAAVAYQPVPKTKRSAAAELARSLRRYA